MGSSSKPNVPEHSHCRICGKVISPGKQFCSFECEKKHLSELAALEKAKRSIIVLLIVSPILLIIFTLLIRFLF